jgi:3-hydroxyacyl-CoA dehydrogenase
VLTIETVAVLGGSEGGAACAVLAALAGCAVRLHAAEGALSASCAAMRRRVDLALAQGAITPTERQRILDGVLFTSDLDLALTGADLAVDAGAGAPAAALADGLRATATVATAGTTPTRLAAALPQPGRVLALRLADAHGPVPRVDVVGLPTTSPHVLERARSFAARVNRAARVPASP